MLSAVLANTKLISECIENTLGEILRAQRIGMSEGFCEKQSQTETLGFSETILTPSGGIWDCYIAQFSSEPPVTFKLILTMLDF